MKQSLTDTEIGSGFGKHAWNVDVMANYVPLMVVSAVGLPLYHRVARSRHIVGKSR